MSATVAVLLVAGLVSFGTFYAATTNGQERLRDARHATAESLLRQRNTAVEMRTASYNATSDTLTAVVTNNGSTTLRLNDTDVLVDNDYETNATLTVRGAAGSRLWTPGETLEVAVRQNATPSRVKVVTGPGVAVTGVV
ncbi:MAG: fla cluster protein FlaF [Halobacteriaceae archaeon]